MFRHSASHYILISILSLWVISCKPTPDSVVHTLSLVEKCMETYPDSAFNMLNRIPNPETLRGKAQADYALLMTQAMDKKYMKPESDSLITLAVGYYGSHEDNWVAKGKAFFYYGRVMKELNRPEDAMRYYLKAKEIFDDSKEYRILGLISEEMGTLNWNQDLSNEALLNYRNALKYYSVIGDALGMSYSTRSIGRYYLSSSNHSDSAYIYYQRALAIAHESNCISELTILQELGLLYRMKKDYGKAEYYLLQALELDKDVSLFSEIYLSLGYTYFLMNNREEAEKYLIESSEISNDYTKVDAYYFLAELEKMKKNPWKVIEYKEKTDSLNKIIQKSETKEIVADLQKKYQNEKLQRENLQLEIKSQAVVLLCFILFLIILFASFFVYYKHLHHKERMREIERQIMINTEEIALYQKEMVDYQQLQSETEDYHSNIGELKGKVLLLQGQNDTLAELMKASKGEVEGSFSSMNIMYMATFRMMLSVKCGLFKGELSRSDWERLFELFNYIYDGALERLKNEYPVLTKHDLEICCLLKFGFTNEELNHVFPTALDSITKAKGRLKKHLNLSSQDGLELFLRRY